MRILRLAIQSKSLALSYRGLKKQGIALLFYLQE